MPFTQNSPARAPAAAAADLIPFGAPHKIASRRRRRFHFHEQCEKPKFIAEKREESFDLGRLISRRIFVASGIDCGSGGGFGAVSSALLQASRPPSVFIK